MKNALLQWYLAGWLAVMPVVASAQTVATDKQSCDRVRYLLDVGSPAGAVVRDTVAAGMTLAEATVFAMVCGGEENRVAIATAGVELAGNLAQAQSVATAVKATAGQTGAVAVAVDKAMLEYARLMPQPNVHQDEYTPTGGGVSPAT